MALTSQPSLANLPDDREYLVNLYNQLWINLSGAETRLLQFLGLYGVAVGLFVNATPKSLPPGSASIATTLVSLWVALVALDANHWAQRNHALVILVEQRLASNDLLSQLVPSRYRELRYDLGSIYFVHLCFVGIIAVALIISTFISQPDWAVLVSSVLLVLGVVLVNQQYRLRRDRFIGEFSALGHTVESRPLWSSFARSLTSKSVP